MLSSRMRGQDASPGIPARWMTASAPWQAAVMASRSVTDAWTASSAGPAVSGAMSSTRSVRPGRASLGRNIDPTRPAAPVMTMTDTRQPPSHGRTQSPAHRPSNGPASSGPSIPARSQTGTRSYTHSFYQSVRIVGSCPNGLDAGFADTASDERSPHGDYRGSAHSGGGRGAGHRARRLQRAGLAPRGPP